VETSLWKPGCGKVDVEASLYGDFVAWKPRCGNHAVETSLRKPRCGNLSVESSLWKSRCGNFVVETSLWNPRCGNPRCGILAMEASLRRHQRGSYEALWGLSEGPRHLAGSEKLCHSRTECESSIKLLMLRLLFLSIRSPSTVPVHTNAERQRLRIVGVLMGATKATASEPLQSALFGELSTFSTSKHAANSSSLS
jgi:hypothetical protein